MLLPSRNYAARFAFAGHRTVPERKEMRGADFMWRREDSQMGESVSTVIAASEGQKEWERMCPS